MTPTLPTPVDVKLMNTTAFVLFVVFALMLVGTLVAWASHQPVFAVRSLLIQGDVSHNNAMTLRANVAPRLNGTFFTLDMGAAQDAFEAIPWVRRAVVHREFPGRLRVQLEEHDAVAYWGRESESLLVNHFGEVFEANLGEVEHDNLPRLNGPEGSALQVLAMHQRLRPRFETLGLGLEQLTMTGHGGWRARLDTQAELELGSGSVADVLARTDQFLTTLTQVVTRYGRNPEALVTADLRHDNGYAIRLRGVSTLAADGQTKQTTQLTQTTRSNR